MSKEMTAEGYLNSNKRHGWFSGDAGDGIHEDYARTYGDLRAKEAVKEFAEELIANYTNKTVVDEYVIINFSELKSRIKHLAKQKGVEI